MARVRMFGRPLSPASYWRPGRRAGTARTWLRAVRTCALVSVAASCGDRGSPVEPGAAGVDRSWVIGAAAAALDARGRFVLPAAPEATGELSRAQATALGAAYVTTFGPAGLLDAWEQDQGAAIDVAQLRPCPRTVYAATPYVAPADDVLVQIRRYVGAQWLVSLCDPAGASVVSVAVSALATDVRVEGGRIVTQPVQAFFSVGIPAAVGEVPFAPAAAVDLAARATGRRITEVPVLVRAPIPYAAQVAKWRLVLDGPVWVRGTRSGVRRQVTELYVGFGESWHTTALQSPDPSAAARDSLTTPPATPSGPPGAAVALAARPGYSLQPYEPVSVEVP